MDVYGVVFFLINVLAWTKAQRNCTIPTGDQFARTKYGPAISAHARQFPASTIDGNGYFRAGAQVPTNFRIRLHCLRDQYGDSIHNMYSSVCKDGAWSPALPSCLDHAKCGLFPYVRGGIPSERRSSGETYLHGHVITFRCSDNRRLIGRNKIECDDGKWSTTRFRCVEQTVSRTCGLPPHVEGATVTGDSLEPGSRYPSGSSVTYQCVSGRQMTGNSSTVVCSNGRWSEVKFKCETVKPDTMKSSCTIDGITCVSSDGSDGCLQGQLICNGQCNSTRWACEVSHVCIYKSYVCDDEWDCPDGSDERNCDATTTTAKLNSTPKQNHTTEARTEQRSDVHLTTGAMKTDSSSAANKPTTVGPQPTTRMSTGEPFTLPNRGDKFVGVDPVNVTRQVESATVQTAVVSSPYGTPFIAGAIAAVSVAFLIITCLVCLVACLIYKRRKGSRHIPPPIKTGPRDETEMGNLRRDPLPQIPENIYEEIDRRQSRDNVYTHEQETVPVENTYLELGDVSPDTHMVDRISSVLSSSYGDAIAITPLLATDTDEQSETWREPVGNRGSSYASVLTFAKGYQGGENKQPLSESSGYASEAESGAAETTHVEDTGNTYERPLKHPSLFDDGDHVYGTIDNANAPHDMCLDYETPVSRRDSSHVNEDSTQTGNTLPRGSVEDVTTNDQDYLHPVNESEARTGSMENNYLHPIAT